MKIKQALLSLSVAIVLLAPQSASAHSSFMEKKIVEGTTNYLTLQVPHGCGANATKKVIIDMANGEDVEFAFQRIKPVLSFYKIKTEYGDVVPFVSHGTEYTTDLKRMVIKGIRLPTDFVLNAKIRGTAPLLENLPAGEDPVLKFKVTQICTHNTQQVWDPVTVEVIENTEGSHGH